MPSNHRGFTLIELLIAVVIIAILASVALPAYQNYIKKAHANTAASDLAALSSSIENYFQGTLGYPETLEKITTWNPASNEALFVFQYENNDPGYTLTATGKGSMSGCTLILNEKNVRELPQGVKACGGFSW
ncbi:TPA: prepilin-type N-terminal cleavage/methylation domain-containing protein [Citrobacter freundii]|nr:prepilin-type N-terminal cleavage/methylation domain-containing protein [Citrobacter freundii]